MMSSISTEVYANDRLFLLLLLLLLSSSSNTEVYANMRTDCAPRTCLPRARESRRGHVVNCTSLNLAVRLRMIRRPTASWCRVFMLTLSTCRSFHASRWRQWLQAHVASPRDGQQPASFISSFASASSAYGVMSMALSRRSRKDSTFHSGWVGDRYVKVFMAFGPPAKERAHQEITNLGPMRDGPRGAATANSQQVEDMAATTTTTMRRTKNACKVSTKK